MGEPSKVKVKDHPALTSDGHTPGPWMREERSVFALQHAGFVKGKEIFENRFYVHVQPGRNTPPEELEANAALIAQAPTLLAQNRELVEALTEICEECQQTNGGEGAALPFTVRLWDIARLALAKMKS